jgi:hypothetical protein
MTPRAQSFVGVLSQTQKVEATKDYLKALKPKGIYPTEFGTGSLFSPFTISPLE